MRRGDNNSAGLVVLLDGGTNLVIASNNTMPSQAAFTRAAKAIAERL